MPAEKTLRPWYFGCSTTPPRGTAVSLSGSRMAISAAVSVSASVSSSSALRKRDFQTVTTAALPWRSTLAGPRLITPFRDEFAHALQGLRLPPPPSQAEIQASQEFGEHMKRPGSSSIDLDAVFLALHQCVFGLDLPLRRRETGHELSRFVDQFVDAQEFFVSVGQFAIHAAACAAMKRSRASRHCKRMISAARFCSGVRSGLFGSLAKRFVPARQKRMPAAPSRLSLSRNCGLAFGAHRTTPRCGKPACSRMTRASSCTTGFAPAEPSIGTLPDAALRGRFLRPLAQIRDQATLASRLARHAGVAAVQDQPMMSMELVFAGTTRSSPCSTSSEFLPGASPCDCRRETYGCRPRWSVRRKRRSTRHWRSCGRRRAGLPCLARARHLPAMVGHQPARQLDHVLRLGPKQPDGLDQLAHPLLAERHHFLRRVGEREQRRVALLTPASVACADSTTATSSVKGLRCSSSPFGSGLAACESGERPR